MRPMLLPVRHAFLFPFLAEGSGNGRVLRFSLFPIDEATEGDD